MLDISSDLRFTILIAIVLLPLVVNLVLWRKDRQLAQSLRKQLAEENDQLRIPCPPPKVSFLVAAWNESSLIQRSIQSILSISYPNLELVLAAGGNDDTYQQALACQTENLIILEQKAGEGKQYSLQRCLQIASGDIIYLTDGDCLVSQETFSNCIRTIFNGQETVVSGSFYIPLPEINRNPFILSQAANRAYTAAHMPKYSNGLLGGNCVMTRQALEEAGAFNSPVHSGTDYDLALRLRKTGRRIYFEIFSSIESELPTNLTAYFRQQARWIRNLIIHGLHYRKIYRGLPDPNLFFSGLRTSLLSIFMLSVPVLSILLISLKGTAWFVGISLVATWILLFVHAYFSRLRYRAFSNIWLGMKFYSAEILLIPVFILIDFLAWATPLLDYPIRSRRERW